MMLTKSELEIMNILWQAGRPLSRNEIINFSSRKSWKDGSIHILLNGLLKKEAIREDGHVKCGKTYGRLFAPNINCEDYYAEEVFSVGGAERIPIFAAALIRREDISIEMIDALEAMLEEKRAQLSDGK